MSLRYLKNATTLEYDEEKCVGCGLCEIVCPHGVFEVTNGKASLIDRDACMECGACAMNCAPKAITVSAGVGCAAAVITGALRGTEPTCDCGADDDEEPPGGCCC